MIVTKGYGSKNIITQGYGSIGIIQIIVGVVVEGIRRILMLDVSRRQLITKR